MRADTVDLRPIFGRDARFTVPLFQRPYVWNREDNWAILWDDIRQTVERVEAAADDEAPAPHFLGAVVFDRIPQSSSELETRQVIDGQQRLTTLQLFLRAARTVAAERSDERAVRLLGKFLENDSDLFDASRHPDHRFKVWPTNADRAQFRSVMNGEPVAGRLAEAVAFFRDAIDEWLARAEHPASRMEALVQTVREQLRLVVIDLEEHDDAQVVFETLNSRGTPLAAADLVKNLLFREGEQSGVDLDKLYLNHWAAFDEDEWRTVQTTGRITRRRLDVFLTHWLTMRSRQEIPSSSLFRQFEAWFRSSGLAVEAVIPELRRYADIYDWIDQHPFEGPEGRFFYRLRVMDTSTPFPLLLQLYGLDSAVLSEPRRQRAIRAVDSYLMRRTVLGLTNRDYNNLFRDLVTAVAQRPEAADDAVIDLLSRASGLHRRWPNDEEFATALREAPLYQQLQRRHLRILLEGLEDHLRSGYTEQLTTPLGDRLASKLTIEHVMPQSWAAHWPVLEDDPSEGEDRSVLVHTLGNLTLLTDRLNPAVGNLGWKEKRDALSRHSLLRITTGSILNTPVDGAHAVGRECWDERAIAERADHLAGVAVEVWPSSEQLRAVRPLSSARA